MGTYRPDSEILQFLWDRLHFVHGENDMYDYMHEFKRIIDKMKKEEWNFEHKRKLKEDK